MTTPSNQGPANCNADGMNEKIFHCAQLRMKYYGDNAAFLDICFDQIDHFTHFNEFCASKLIHMRISLTLPIGNVQASIDPAHGSDAMSKVAAEAQNASMSDQHDMISIHSERDIQMPLPFGSDPIVIFHRNDNEDVADDTLCLPPFEEIANIDSPIEFLLAHDSSQRENIGVQRAKPHGRVSAVTKKGKTLHRRVINQNNNGVVNCNLRKCTEVFGSHHALAYHAINYHAKGVKNTFRCHLCKKTLRSKSSLREHMGAVHAGLKPFKCTFPMCSKIFALKRGRKQHMNAMHITKNAFDCPNCPRKFNYKSNLKRHLANEHGVGVIYNCYSCKMSLYDRSKLQRHMNVKHTGLNLSKCSVCLKGFATKNQLQKHMNGKHSEVAQDSFATPKRT